MTDDEKQAFLAMWGQFVDYCKLNNLQPNAETLPEWDERFNSNGIKNLYMKDRYQEFLDVHSKKS